MATKDEPKDTPDSLEQTTKAPALITLYYMGAGASGDTLSIGDAHYPIVNARVSVAPEHLEAAQQAGFQP